MRSRKTTILIITAAILGLGSATFAFTFPGPTGCMLFEYAGLQSLPDGTLAERGISEVERLTFIELLREARTRIEESFGAPRARPVVVFLRESNVLWPFHFNDYASSHFIGSRACVVIGPKGRNVDVVAHELMHAELFERVGYWRRFTEIPAWFDEGVAMQVDFRPRYSMSEQRRNLNSTGFVGELKSYRQFFGGDGEQLTQHYAAAKAEVARWLVTAGPHTLYEHFERIRAGESFDAIVGNELRANPAQEFRAGKHKLAPGKP